MIDPASHIDIESVEIAGEMRYGFESILTPEALAFVAALEHEFGERRRQLIEKRAERQDEIDNGHMPAFLKETREIRNSQWRVAPIPRDLIDRRVEITCPVDRKMIINALNSGANVCMADFEDSTSPTWSNIIDGQINVRDAVNGTISYVSLEGKEYHPGPSPATLMVRPRGWHLVEKHLLVDGKPVSASLFDFGIFFYHNAQTLLDKGSGPYFYLPKLEGHIEARLWNDVFIMAQVYLGIPLGSIRATVLIETVLAAFEMEEILYELRGHSAGLNCGRWDYIFSFIKKFRAHPEFMFPDRSILTMSQHFLHSYSLLLIQTCHKRGAHAIGGMAAQIPIKSDPEANDVAMAKVRMDKTREVGDGHDGSWVAHPGLVLPVKEVFDRYMPGPHQIHTTRHDVSITAADLLTIPKGDITHDGVLTNILVSIHYLDAWLRGTGCIPINNLMEDAATGEISRAQLWQWLHHWEGAHSRGVLVSRQSYADQIAKELTAMRSSMGDGRFDKSRVELSARLVKEWVMSDNFVEFLTLAAYDHLD